MTELDELIDWHSHQAAALEADGVRLWAKYYQDTVEYLWQLRELQR